jgi:hypothetical protein
MTFKQAQDTARQYGAKMQAREHAASECWIDRIMWLPRAAERGELATAIAEANRYA